MLIKRIKFLISIIIPIFVFFLMSQNTFASSYSSAIVDFYTNQQVNSTVNLPWSANPGSNKFWLNNVYVNDTSLNGSNITYIAGRVVSEFRNIGLVSNNTYSAADFCGYNTLTASSVNAAPNWQCRGLITIVFTDTSTSVIDNINAVVNWDSVAKTGILYFDFNSAVDSSKSIDFVQFRFYAPQEGKDILSRTSDWYNVPLFTLFDVRSTVNGYEIPPDVSDELLQQQIAQNDVIINQNDQIINNQNQNTEDIINNQNQNTEDIIKSNQNCYESPNLIDLPSALGSDVRINNFILSLQAGTYTISFKLDDFTLGSLTSFNIFSQIRLLNSVPDFTLLTINSSTQKNKRYSYTFTINEPTSTSLTSNIRINNTSYNAGARATLSDIQIEKGSKATEYIAYGTEKCVNINQEYYDQQRQADDNISNQTTNDIEGATNQQTTNLIGTISSFVSALQSINTNGSCELTLPFPVLLGGSQTVNPCNGADKAPTIIAAASSLLLITVFVPLAFILVKMIYNEIRSFTNG